MFIPSKASISDIAISEINNFVDVLIKLGKEAFTLSNMKNKKSTFWEFC